MNAHWGTTWTPALRAWSMPALASRLPMPRPERALGTSVWVKHMPSGVMAYSQSARWLSTSASKRRSPSL